MATKYEEGFAIIVKRVAGSDIGGRGGWLSVGQPQ